jgi:Holliday junction DNA helicase RuvA
MIAFIRGSIAEKTPTYVVMEAHGVGYHLNISLYTYSQLGNEPLQLLHTHLVVKEDAHVLYGFVNEQERSLFRLLISVNGVGPNTARMILNALNPAELHTVIATGNLPALKSVKGIGEKTAQRVILDLKDKIVKTETPLQASVLSAIVHNKNREEALQALVILGFTRQMAEKALDKTSKSLESQDLPVDQLIREALKNL